MGNNQQSQAAPTQAIGAPIERSIEYQAFGSAETVKLSIAIVKNWLVTPTASGKLPTDSDIMKFMMLCKARQLNPWEGDAFLVGYDGQKGPNFSLITAHQAFLKRAEAHGGYDGMQSGVILQDAKGNLVDLEGDFVPTGYTLLGGWCKVYRKDQTYPKIARLNVEIFDKGFAQWKSNKPGMIVKCSEADALRGAFPNTLGGMYSESEAALIQASGTVPGNGHSEALPSVPVISEEQRMALVQLATDTGVIGKLGEIVNAAGFDLLANITADRYGDVAKAIREAGGQPVAPPPATPPPAEPPALPEEPAEATAKVSDEAPGAAPEQESEGSKEPPISKSEAKRLEYAQKLIEFERDPDKAEKIAKWLDGRQYADLTDTQIKDLYVEAKDGF